MSECEGSDVVTKGDGSVRLHLGALYPPGMCLLKQTAALATGNLLCEGGLHVFGCGECRNVQ